MNFIKTFVAAILLVVAIFLFVTFAAWLISDVNFTYKMCVQYGGCYFLTIVLSIILLLFYVVELDAKTKEN